MAELSWRIAAASTSRRRASPSCNGRFERAIGQQQHELFAAEARDEIVDAIGETRAQAREFAQAFIAVQMPVRVVQGFEGIGVDQHQRELAMLHRLPFPLGREALVEAAAVRDAGQAIDHRQRFQLAIGGFEFGDDARKMDRAGDLVGDRIEHFARFGVEEIRLACFRC